MKIKKGDNVIVKTGADSGKTGKVLHAFPKTNQIIVAGVSIRKKHQRARRVGQKGQIVEKASRINVSNVLIVDPKKGVGSRVSISREGGKRVRIARKSGAVIE